MKLAVRFRQGNIMTPSRQDLDAKARICRGKEILGKSVFFFRMWDAFFFVVMIYMEKTLH